MDSVIQCNVMRIYGEQPPLYFFFVWRRHMTTYFLKALRILRTVMKHCEKAPREKFTPHHIVYLIWLKFRHNNRQTIWNKSMYDIFDRFFSFLTIDDWICSLFKTTKMAISGDFFTLKEKMWKTFLGCPKTET